MEFRNYVNDRKKSIIGYLDLPIDLLSFFLSDRTKTYFVQDKYYSETFNVVLFEAAESH